MTDGMLYHTIRHANGAWQDPFGLVEGAVHGGPSGFAAVGSAGVGTDLQLVGVGTDAQLYHTIHHANGTWQSPFGLIGGQVHGGPGEFHAVACAGVGTDLHLIALGADEKLYHTIRHANGSWQSQFGVVQSQVRGGPPSFFGGGCAGVGTDVHVIGVGSDVQLYHTIRRANGTWQSSFGLVEGQVGGGPSHGFGSASCAGVGTALQVVGVGSNGQLYHTIRKSDGSWQSPFGLVEGPVAGGPPTFRAVGCAGVGAAMQLVGVGSDGQLYHTIRKSDGSWQSPFGLVERQVGGGPPAFTSVTSGGVSSDLQVVGGNWTGGWV